MSTRKTKSLSVFVKQNRSEIDEAIRQYCLSRGSSTVGGSLNDQDREKWVLNEEGLYLWARSEGVDI